MQLLKTGPFEGWVVIGVDVVKPQHWGALFQQARAQVKADEAGGTGNKDSHSRERKRLGTTLFLEHKTFNKAN
jgi:hypothetical protein